MAKNFVGNSFCAVFLKISGSENFMDKMGGGVYQDIPSQFFCLTVTEIFLGELSFVSQNFR